MTAASNDLIGWGRTMPLERQNIVHHVRNSVRAPRVTIGMPTYRRANVIRRALASIARQSFRDFVVIVSDNAGVDQATLDAVRAFEADLPEVYVIAQQTNLGAIPNQQVILACATTEYFMWLADDDEISDNYLAELVALLDGDPAAAAAMGVPLASYDTGPALPRRQVRCENRSRAARVFKWAAFQKEDSLFYGLHRTEFLRRCRFDSYVYPNVGVLTNFCYVFLFDLIWQGPVRYSDDATWTAHHDCAKEYNVAKAGGVRNKIRTFMRRLNVYALYNARTARRSIALLLLTLPASVIGIVSDVLLALRRVAARRLSVKQ